MGGRSMHGGQSVHNGGATVYDMGKTPMAKNTPLYHPQSQWGGNNDDDGQDFMRGGAS